MNKHIITIAIAATALLVVNRAQANPYGYYTNVTPQAYGNYYQNYYNGYQNYYNGYQNYYNGYQNYYNGYQNYYNGYQYCRPNGYQNHGININIKNTVKNTNVHKINKRQNNFYGNRRNYDNWYRPCRPQAIRRDRVKETHEYYEKHTYERETKRRYPNRRFYR